MRRAAWLALAIALGPAVACARAPVSPTERAAERLRAALRDEAARAGKAPTLSTTPGALGTETVMLMIPGAYPGTGVARVVVAGGRSYGVHGERDLADLVRERGWIKAPPPVADFVRVVNDAQFEGLLIVDEQVAPQLAKTAGGLELRLSRRTFPSQAREDVRVRFGTSGKALVEVAAAQAQGTSGGGGDALADAARALDKGSAAERSAAVNKLSTSKDPRARALLARATTLGNEQLAADAIIALGATPEAARALREAWAPLDQGRRAALVRLAAEAHGDDFAKQLK